MSALPLAVRWTEEPSSPKHRPPPRRQYATRRDIAGSDRYLPLGPYARSVVVALDGPCSHEFRESRAGRSGLTACWIVGCAPTYSLNQRIEIRGLPIQR